MDADECKEEQSNEIEALESIFDSHFKLLTKEPSLSYEVLILPEIGAGLDDPEVHVAVLLNVTYPALYPEVLPVMKLEDKKGSLFKRHMEELDKLALATAEEHKGMALVYQVAEAVREWLADHNVPQKSMHQQMMDNAEAEKAKSDAAGGDAEEKEDVTGSSSSYVSKYAPGTPVTPESFAQWQAEFAAEQKRLRELAGLVEEKRVSEKTGRQIFEENLKLGLEKEAAADNKADDVFWFNEAAYEDDDIPDEDEDEDDEDEDEEAGGADKDDEEYHGPPQDAYDDDDDDD